MQSVQTPAEGRRVGERFKVLIEAALISVVLIVAAIAFAQSYQRWLDPIIDTGRDLYIPEQIANGAKLYRDIRYQYPPLAPYLLALITRGIGSSLTSYMAIGLAQSLAIVAALWLALRRTAGVMAAFVATLCFVSLSFCGASTWGANFLFPYSYGATIGMAMLCVALAAFVHARNAQALAALLVASWCKVEYAIGVLLIVIVLAMARRITWRQLAGFIAAAAASLAAVSFYFRDTKWISANVFAASLTKGATAKHFFAFVSGTAEWRERGTEIVIAIAAMSAILWLMRRGRWIFAIPIIAVSLFICDHSFFRAWGVLQWIALAWALWRDRDDPLLFFVLFAIAATLRVPLNVSPAWYGFVLIVPVYALMAYVLFAYLPRFRKVDSQRLLWLVPILVIVAHDLWEQHERYAVKSFPIVSSRGTFYDWNADRARILNEFIATAGGGTLAVMPEGITLNYLTRMRTPLTFHTFTPVETADAQVEDEILFELASHPPDRVAVVTRDVTEYGYHGFGVDYDLRVMAWLRTHYHVETERNGPKFSMLVFRSGERHWP